MTPQQAIIALTSGLSGPSETFNAEDEAVEKAYKTLWDLVLLGKRENS